MNRAFGIFRTLLFMVVLLIPASVGCNYPGVAAPVREATSLPPTSLPTASPTVVPTKIPPTIQPHVMIPFATYGKAQTIHDQVDKNYASQKRAYGGDEYRVGRFERPFDPSMNYLGYIDIVKSTMIRSDPRFIYVTIQVANPVDSADEKPAYFGLEIDLNLDGRSRYLIRGSRPLTEEWTVEDVDVWESTSSEQNLTESGSGIPVTGTAGFDVSLLLAGKGEDIDLAWIRQSPGVNDTVEIAFKNSLVGGEKGKFIWRPFTDGAPFAPKLYDLQNSFTLEQAGSPISGEKDYPLKAVFAVDNTCRVSSGYEASGYEVGICLQPSPPEQSIEPVEPQRNPFRIPEPSHR